MNWVELSIVVNHDVQEFVTNILEENGSNGVVIEDSNDLNGQLADKFGEIYELNPNDYPESGVRIKAYFNELDFSQTLKSKILESIKELSDLNQVLFEYKEEIIKESDWENEWKNYFHPFKASDHFTIVPSWESYQKEDDSELCIELDPGMAFGTGDHPTTSMCLNAIEQYVSPKDSVIDVGTGSGILSIACHLLGVKHIKAVDLDEMAVRVAKENFEKNSCEKAIETTTGNLLHEESGKYDVVIANILAHIIDEMIEDAYNTLNEKGRFITSGIIEEKSDEITEHMKRAGFNIISINHDNGWVCIVGEKASN
ncbi:ribosomal protein L11 methyltransferase [Staphylococcus piscifermentans]|uniref:Ribosomal protein L11 methyltransferase n=1 Tax=Staphylococcus piscifermentans TaxID=70258 RepID=A0A239U460_9STAP|nr:50S ribosomal protein L11 methyltransferase [Staphylococcus piscifermentans]RTX84480.1 50S ribosomal protein L11 methyltransferase [Staphylococcus piscifermentans]GEP84023.1 ribosomal protein L11 methyltransferase [Staphylococcus piscifermentans]SNV03753.1 ribosomal protein L11 methyltransferase [Staphylococcus piscifermentans]